MGSSPIRRMTELLSRRRSSSSHHTASHPHVNANGRLAPNFLLPPEPSNHHRSLSSGNFIKDCLSPQPPPPMLPPPIPAESSGTESPVLGHKSCAIHGIRVLGGGMDRGPPPNLVPCKVSTAVQTCQPLPDTPPPPPPTGFEAVEDCLSASSTACSPPSTSWRTSDLHHHVHYTLQGNWSIKNIWKRYFYI